MTAKTHKATVYVVKRTSKDKSRVTGHAVYIGYTDSKGKRVRQLWRTVRVGEGAAVLHEAIADATNERNIIVGNMTSGTHVSPRTKENQITFAEYVKRHYVAELRNRRHPRSGLPLRIAEKEIQRCTTGSLGRYWGGWKLSDITTDDIEEFLRIRGEGYDVEFAGGTKTRHVMVGNGALNRDRSRLSELWNRAKKHGYVSGENPCSAIDRKSESARKDYLTPEEADRFFAAVHPARRSVFEFLLHTGLRQGACRGITWGDIDYRSKSPHISLSPKLSKSGKRVSIPLGELALDVLKEERRRGHNLGRDDYVFVKDEGGAQLRTLDTVWANGLRRAGLRYRGAHVLRHSCATYIVLSGGTAFDVKEQLGHATSAQGEEYVAEFGNARAVERSAKVAAYYRREIAPEPAVELRALPVEVPVETPPLYR